jgi:hypothetical protein
MLPGPPFLFGAVLALFAIFVTWMIPSNHKSPILLTQKSNKDRTVVKIGNSTATYNRTSSSSSLAGNNNLININSIIETNPNILLSDVVASTSAAIESQEQQELLIDDSSNANMFSFHAPSSSASFSASNMHNNENLNYFSNPIGSLINEGKHFSNASIISIISLLI